MGDDEEMLSRVGHGGLNDRRMVLLLFLVPLIAYTLTAGVHHPWGGDMYTYVSVTRHLVEQGTLILDDDHGIAWNAVAHVSLGADGHYYSKYAPGYPLLCVPFFVLLGPFGCFFLSALAGALTIPILYKFCRLYGVGKTAASLSSMGYAFCSLNWVYARTTFPAEVLTLLVTAGMYLVVSSLSAKGAKRCIYAGFLLGYVVLVKSVVAVVWVPVLFYLLWKRRVKEFVFLLIPLYLCTAAFMGYNQAIYGDPLTTGYHVNSGTMAATMIAPFNELEAPYGWSTPPHLGLTGLLFDPYHGIFSVSPALLLSFLGFVHSRDKRDRLLLLGAVFFSLVFAQMSWWAWWGCDNFGARLIHPVDAILIVPLSLALEENAGKRWFLAVFLTLFFASFVISALGALTETLWTTEPYFRFLKG